MVSKIAIKAVKLRFHDKKKSCISYIIKNCSQNSPIKQLLVFKPEKKSKYISWKYILINI